MVQKKPSEEYVEQKITKQVTINAGNSGAIEITIPSGRDVFLKGYGYTWFTLNTYTLSTGINTFPSRTDQEGSPAIPIVFGTPFHCRSGGKLRLGIVNGDSSAHTYDVVFYIITNELLDEESTGGDLNLSIGASGGVASEVSITDSTGTTNVDVVTRADGRKALVVDTEIESARTATHSAPTIAATSTSALASNTNRAAALFVNDSDEEIYLNIGGSASMNAGIRLNANGGAYEMSKEHGNLSTAAITAICASGSKVLLVTEFE